MIVITPSAIILVLGSIEVILNIIKDAEEIR